MQHVASQTSVHHSQHHGPDLRGRAPASEPKQPATPFSLLLDGAEEAPPPRPKQPDDATKPSSRTAANDQTRGEQTQAQQSPEQEQAPKAAGAEEKTAQEPAKPVGTVEETAVATSGNDETKTTETATETVDATATAQPTSALVAPIPVPAEPAPAAATDNAAIDDADLAKAAAAAGLKAEQPAAPKGKAEQKAATNPSDADESQPATAAPAADTGETAKPVEAAKSHDEMHSPAAAPAEDKPEHARLHEAAGHGETAGVDALANSQAIARDTDSAPAGKAADGTQVVNVQHQADRTGSAAAATAPAPNTTSPAVPLAGLAVEIAARAQAGRNHFEIRLDPPELGKIHVSLDVDKSGQVTSRLVVDRAETLDALRRDAPNLERALQDAGLKTGDNGLQFTLRDQSFAGRDDGFTPANTARLVVPDPDLATVEAAAGYGPLTRAGGGVDIRV